MQAIMETIFEALYLFFAIACGIFLLVRAKKRPQYILFGIASLVLGLGDSYHLIPRMYALWNGGTANFPDSLGVGKFVTSITMTIFYVLLYYFLKVRYSKKVNWYIEVGVLFLAFVRIVLCLFPQNEWTSADASLLWGIIRNIPFALLGALIVYLAFKWCWKEKYFKFLGIAIILSFGFYLPVVLLAGKYPLVGLLMLPKTVCYVWILIMGLRANLKEIEVKEVTE